MCDPGECGMAGERTEIVRRLETLIGREGVSDDYVRFRIDVLKAQWAAYDAVADSPASRRPTRARRDGQGAVAEGALLDPDDIAIDPQALHTLLNTLCAALDKRGGQSAEAARLASAAQQEPGLLGELARNAAGGTNTEIMESLVQRLEVGSEVLVFFGRVLAAPFVSQAARALAKGTGGPEPSSATSGGCTVCGSSAGLARLRRDDGKRVLCCSLCGETWSFARLECPFCSSRDDEGLRYLRVSEADARWVETCGVCRRYIKTVDERKLPQGESAIPVVEDVATLHLDMLAEREGCMRRLPYAALV